MKQKVGIVNGAVIAVIVLIVVLMFPWLLLVIVPAGCTIAFLKSKKSPSTDNSNGDFLSGL